MSIHIFGLRLPKGDIMGYGCTAKEAEGMCRKAYKAMTSHWDEEYAPRDWIKAKDYFGHTYEELELPGATYDNEAFKKGAL
jgi:hypothetical protein